MHMNSSKRIISEHKPDMTDIYIYIYRKREREREREREYIYSYVEGNYFYIYGEIEHIFIENMYTIITVCMDNLDCLSLSISLSLSLHLSLSISLSLSLSPSLSLPTYLPTYFSLAIHSSWSSLLLCPLDSIKCPFRVIVYIYIYQPLRSDRI